MGLGSRGGLHGIPIMTCTTRRISPLLLVLVWLAFALRVFRLDFQSLWRDEVDAIRFATRALPDLLATFRTPGENGPLFFLALRPWLAVAGRSEFALRFPAAWAGTLAIPLIYVLVRRLAAQLPALVTMLLATTAPYLVWYGQDAKMYAALTLLVPLSLWLTIEVAQRGTWWRWVLLYTVTTLCFYTHLLAALVVPVQVLWLLILSPHQHRPSTGFRPVGRWVTAGGYVLALVLPYLPLLGWQVSMWSSPFETGHPFVPLPDILTVLAVAFSDGVVPGRTPLMLLPAMLALVAGAVLWTSQGKDSPAERSGVASRWQVAAVLLIWLLLPPLTVYAISLGMPLFTDRYLIWCMPAFLALASLGIIALARAWRPLGLATLSAFLIVNVAGVWAQGSGPVKSDFRAAASFVLAHRQPGDLMIYQIPYGRYTFTYYSSDEGKAPARRVPAPELPWMDGPYTNNNESETALADEMARGTSGSPAAWLVASEVPMWDARDLTRAWLSAHGTVTEHADFARVSVTRYQFPK